MLDPLRAESKSSTGASECEEPLVEEAESSDSINILLAEDALAPVLFISSPMPMEEVEESGFKSLTEMDHGSSSALDTRTISSSDPSVDFAMNSFIALLLLLLLLFLLLSDSLLLCSLVSDDEVDGVAFSSAAVVA